MELTLYILRSMIFTGLATVSFAIIMGISIKDLKYVFGVSTISFCSLMYTSLTFRNDLLAFLSASLFVSALSLYFSYTRKKPLTVYLAAGLIPLLPGRAIFLSILGLVTKNKTMFYSNLEITLTSLAVITISVILTTSITNVIKNIILNRDDKILHFED